MKQKLLCIFNLKLRKSWVEKGRTWRKEAGIGTAEADAATNDGTTTAIPGDANQALEHTAR